MIKLSIIIPVYNEEKTIEEILRRVGAVKLPSGIRKEIIVVDDGSTDSSKFKVQSVKFKGLKKIFHEKNLGKGAAIRTSIKHAAGDVILIQDADLEYDPSYIPTLLRPIMQNKTTVVYGTRLLNYPLRLWGPHKTILPVHLVANKILTFLTNLLYGGGLTDMETGYKLFRREILENMDIRSNRFDFEAEVTAKILKLRIPIKEVPIKVQPRTYKDGKKIGWEDGLIAVWTLLKYRVVN